MCIHFFLNIIRDDKYVHNVDKGFSWTFNASKH